ncbi:MAG: hypothetical protein FJ053_10380 [Cyanobacteria bacterium M_surface_10_m1_298]|nr:hypothetical protein [Cyanobacteria bacterium M_surface_10_m1_298]
MATSLSDQVDALRWRRRLSQWLLLLVVVALVLLFADWFDTNEADKLPLALQRIRPAWLPADWYLNQPQPHQWLFLELAGRLISQLGFVVGALVIRLAGYALWCWGVLALAAELGLGMPWLLAALALWLPRQGMVAGEWMLGSAEPKTFAYGLLLLAFVSWRQQRSLWAGLQAGLACSAHVLVGGYGALTLAGLAWWRSAQVRLRGWLALAGALVGAFALYQPVLGRVAELAMPAPALPQALSPAWLYVVFRHPHHLVPSSWGKSWLVLMVVLAGWGVLGAWLARGAAKRLPCHEAQACRDLWLWSALALVPFGVGLLASLADADGVLLQLYPFRLADTLVPLTLVLLGARTLQALVGSCAVRSRVWSRFPLVGLTAIVLVSAWLTSRGAVRCPSQAFAVPEEKAPLYRALMTSTPPGSRVLTPPGGFSDLALRTSRAQVVQFRQVPGSLRLLGAWSRRLADLAGGEAALSEGPGGAAAERRLMAAYANLSASDLATLARRYNVAAVVTREGRPGPLGWQRAPVGSRWWLWLPASAR